jgi:hypothetical protein
VTGTVDDTWVSADGDSLILQRLDPPFEHLLAPGNSEGRRDAIWRWRRSAPIRQ